MQPLVYIVEDDKESLGFLKTFLGKNGFVTQTFEKGSSVISAVEKTEPDLVLLDLVLPDMEGESICQEIRKSYPDLPIIILSSKSSTSEKVQVLNLGADDYITKPYNSEELLARIKTRLRHSAISKSLKLADLEMDLEKIEVYRDGKKINLTPQEFKLLKYLVENKNVVLSRDMILNRVWNYSLEVESRVVDVYMGYLRKKIDDGHKDKLIQSVRGFGYSIKG